MKPQVFSSLLLASLISTPVIAQNQAQINNSVLTVSANNGQSFGTGPSVKFWFSARNPNGAATVDTINHPEIGRFSSRRLGSGSTAAPWNYWFDYRSQRYYVPTINIVGDSNNSYYSYNVDMGTPASEVEGYLVSFRFAIPENYYFPGTDEAFWNQTNSAVGSSMKMAWVTRNGDDTAKGDLLLLTHSGGGNLNTIGNGASVLSKPTSDSHYFSHLNNISRVDHSNRLLAYLKRPAGSVSGDRAPIEWSLVNTLKHTYTNAQKIIKTNIEPMNHRYVAFAGWSDPDRDGRGSTIGSQLLYGDIYVAQGPTAKARIEIGDAAQYENCKWLFIAPPAQWSTQQVTTAFHPDEFEKANYWFITTADGTRYSGPLR